MLPPEVRDSDSPNATPIRIVDDPSAVTVRVLDPDKTHPFRQKELISAVRKWLPQSEKFNSYDVQAVRTAHGIDARSEFAHRMKFGSRQYSQAFADWTIEQYNQDNHFLKKSRTAYRPRPTRRAQHKGVEPKRARTASPSKPPQGRRPSEHLES